MTPGSLVLRNAIMNIFAQAAPVIMAIYTVPLLLHSLGLERFAILSFAWLVLGYAGLFDLGVARATSKVAAEALAANDYRSVSRLGSTAVLLNACLGTVGGLLLATASPLLVNQVLHVPSDLAAEATAAFVVVAAALPVSVILTASRSLLEAGQRFVLINLVQVPANVLLYAVPAVGAAFGAALPSILIMLIATRVVACAAYVALWRVAFGRGDFRLVIDWRIGVRLLRYGGWLTVSSTAAPLIVYGERAIIAGTLALGGLSMYVVPYELVARMSIVPAALTSTLYPAFSSLRAASSDLRGAYGLGLKLLILSLGPGAVIVFVLSGELLVRWIGPGVAASTTIPLQLFVLGAFVNSLAYVPLALLQGVGRPNLPAAIHASEVAPTFVLTWFLASQFGLIGAVVAWLVRASADAIALFAMARIVEPETTSGPGRMLTNALAVLSGVTCVAAVLASAAGEGLRPVIALLAAAGYATWAWRSYFDAKDRRMFGTAIGRRYENRELSDS